MAIYILIGIDPLNQPGVDEIFKYSTLEDAINYVKNWLYNKLIHQSKILGGLKGDINKHISNYIKELSEYNYINFYGEYPGDDVSGQYEYKWSIFEL